MLFKASFLLLLLPGKILCVNGIPSLLTLSPITACFLSGLLSLLEPNRLEYKFVKNLFALPFCGNLFYGIF